MTGYRKARILFKKNTTIPHRRYIQRIKNASISIIRFGQAKQDQIFLICQDDRLFFRTPLTFYDSTNLSAYATFKLTARIFTNS